MTVSQAIAELLKDFENVKLVDHQRMQYDILVVITTDERTFGKKTSATARITTFYRNNKIMQAPLWTIPDIDSKLPDASAYRRKRDV